MRFAHTYWSKPSLDIRYSESTLRQIQTNIFSYALSFTYLKRLGQEVRLYADKIAQEFLNLIPYDEIITIDPQGSTRFWAQSKFDVYELMEPGDIYLDGDVYIKSSEVLGWFTGEDLIVQSVEVDDMIKCEAYTNTRKALEGIDFGEYFNPQILVPVCNTGVVQFNSMELKKKYIDLYKMIMRQCRDSGILESLDKDIHLDVLTEQQSLYEICTGLGYSLGTLFDTAVGPYLKINKDKYTHLISNRKYIMLPLIKKWLEELNPDLYNKLTNKFNEEELGKLIKLLNETRVISHTHDNSINN